MHRVTVRVVTPTQRMLYVVYRVVVPPVVGMIGDGVAGDAAGGVADGGGYCR